MKKKNKKTKKSMRASFVEKTIYFIALTFVFVLPFSLLYIESQKLEIADQTEKTKIALGKERDTTSQHEIKLSTMNTANDGKDKNEQTKAN